MTRNRKGTSSQQDTHEQPDYMSFMLRLYRANDDGKPVWRMSLEPSLTGERRGFASLDDLVEFLRQQMGATQATGNDEQG